MAIDKPQPPATTTPAISSTQELAHIPMLAQCKADTDRENGVGPEFRNPAIDQRV